MIDPSASSVALERCTAYDPVTIKELFRRQLSALGITADDFRGKRVALKPNLVMTANPDRAITTHPAVVEAACALFIEYGASVTIVESPAGPYTEANLRTIYRATGIAQAAQKSGAVLNYDTSTCQLHMPDGVTSKMFDVLKPVMEADIIVNVSKLKTHTLTMMTGAAKNFFGLIAGLGKVEYHARFKKREEFVSSIADLCHAICRAKPVLCLCDAIIGMQGNGPSGGTPRSIGCLLASCNPFALDMAAADIIGLTGQVDMLIKAAERGYCPPTPDRLTLYGESLASLHIADFEMPDTKRGSKFLMLPDFLMPRPVIDRTKCVGCGKCVRHCPVHTIGLKKNTAQIYHKNCIRCFCCQELCPKNAVRIHKNFIFKILK